MNSLNTFNEIFVLDHSDSGDILKELSRNERLFSYYMFRACLPFNKIHREQNHRYSNEIIKLFEFLYENRVKDDFVKDNFVKDIEVYLVYLWSNHGFYFLKESSNSKRTPHKLGLKHLTQDKLILILTELKYKDYEYLLPFIFDNSIDPEMIDTTDIAKSGNNYYGKGFTEEHYKQLSTEIKGQINAYPHLDINGNIVNGIRKIGGINSDELEIVCFWLREALEISKNSEYFDGHITKSIDLLIKFFESGNENLFKEHMKEWIQTNSRLDYVMGFIENYYDSKQIRGHAGAEITVKAIDMQKLNPILLEIETRLPIPEEYRKVMNKNIVLNVSINNILYSGGDYGPLIILAAYNLPNYDDIRSVYGSKQVIYKLPKPLENILNPELAKEFKTSDLQHLIDIADPNDNLYNDLWDLQILLHETVGHASGKFYKHTFQHGDNMTISGIIYQIGDIIDVTDKNYPEMMTEDTSSLEELRAEINALYISIAEMDVLQENGLFKDWYTKLGKEELQKHCIIEMCQHMFRRYYAQGDNFTEIKGAHARANIVITNFLLSQGGIEIIDEIKNIDGIDYHMLGVKLIDFATTFDSIVQLLRLVQATKSTANLYECHKLFDLFTKEPITIEQGRLYKQYITKNKEKLIGPVKAIARLYFKYIPILDESGHIQDVVKGTFNDYFEQNLENERWMLTTNY